MMLSKLLIWFGCLLSIVLLNCVTADLINSDNDDLEVPVQYSDNTVDDNDTAWLSRRRDRRQQQWMPTVIDDAPLRGTVDRASLTPRRERIQSRRRKKLEDASRRSRGGAGRGSRRRGGSNVPETSSPVPTTNIITTTDQQTSTTLTSVHSLIDLVTQSSPVIEVTEDAVGDRGVLMATISDDDDDTMMILMPNNQRAVNACRTMRCPRYKVCLLNIQGLPMCRCPSVYHCRGLERRPVCTVDGSTYRNKCFLRVDECAANRRLRVLHRGSCRVGAGRRSFDPSPPSTHLQRRQRHRQRELDEHVATADRGSHEVHRHRRRGRIRRRRPRHNPVVH